MHVYTVTFNFVEGSIAATLKPSALIPLCSVIELKIKPKTLEDLEKGINYNYTMELSVLRLGKHAL